MKHLIHVLLVVFASTAATLFLGLGATFSGSVALGLAYTFVASAVIIVIGVGSLIAARSAFGLAQAGMLPQMILFWLLMWMALALAPASIIMTAHGWMASAVVLGLVMLLAKLTGGFSSSFKRSWLPVKAKRKK